MTATLPGESQGAAVPCRPAAPLSGAATRGGQGDGSPSHEPVARRGVRLVGSGGHHGDVARSSSPRTGSAEPLAAFEVRPWPALHPAWAAGPDSRKRGETGRSGGRRVAHVSHSNRLEPGPIAASLPVSRRRLLAAARCCAAQGAVAEEHRHPRVGAERPWGWPRAFCRTSTSYGSTSLIIGGCCTTSTGPTSRSGGRRSPPLGTSASL